MSTRAPYLPDAQGEFDLWIHNFSTQIAISPAQFRLDAQEAAEIAAVSQEWRAAYQPTLCARTKTKCTVAAKDAARAMAEGFVRPVAQRIAGDDRIDGDLKVLLGLNPRESRRTKIRPPHNGPRIFVQPVSSLRLKLTFSCIGDGVTKRAKPPGVTHCQIFAAASPTPIDRCSELPLKMLATKSPVFVTFDERDAHTPAYIAARWGIQTGGVSAWSRIASCTVPNGG